MNFLMAYLVNVLPEMFSIVQSNVKFLKKIFYKNNNKNLDNHLVLYKINII